jgi:hypothetical protein
VFAYGLLVPGRPELPAAPDVRQRVGAAAGQPQSAERTEVAWYLRRTKGTVAIQQGGAGTGRLPVCDQEVRHPSAVGRRGEVLSDDEVVGVEERRRGLDFT